MRSHPAGDAGLLANYASFFAPAQPGAVLVEKTSSYFENAAARERLARLLPQAQFVFLLREPVRALIRTGRARARRDWKRCPSNKRSNSTSDRGPSRWRPNLPMRDPSIISAAAGTEPLRRPGSRPWAAAACSSTCLRRP